MRLQRRHHRGFVLLAALAILAIVSVAILALAAAMTYDGRRTMERAQRAQLDQMLLAGAADASQHLRQPIQSGASWDITLPDALLQQDATLKGSVASADESKIVLNIRATLSNHSAEQTLRFEKDANHWTLSNAHIPTDD